MLGLLFSFFHWSWGSFLECDLKLIKMLVLHYTLGIAFSMRLDKRVSMLGREEISVVIRNLTFYSLLSASMPSKCLATTTCM